MIVLTGFLCGLLRGPFRTMNTLSVNRFITNVRQYDRPGITGEMVPFHVDPAAFHTYNLLRERSIFNILHLSPISMNIVSRSVL